MFVIAVPSVPGAPPLGAHLAYDSLAHPGLTAWMTACTISPPP
jgi:hypothetical protein